MLETSPKSVNSKNVLIVFFLQPTTMDLPSSGHLIVRMSSGVFKRPCFLQRMGNVPAVAAACINV